LCIPYSFGGDIPLDRNPLSPGNIEARDNETQDERSGRLIGETVGTVLVSHYLWRSSRGLKRMGV
jgi:hypothetical protein